MSPRTPSDTFPPPNESATKCLPSLYLGAGARSREEVKSRCRHQIILRLGGRQWRRESVLHWMLHLSENNFQGKDTLDIVPLYRLNVRRPEDHSVDLW